MMNIQQKRNWVNEVIGLNVVYTTIRDMIRVDGVTTGYRVARNFAEGYVSTHPWQQLPASFWRAVADVADAEIDAISAPPESLMSALAGFDDHLR